MFTDEMLEKMLTDSEMHKIPIGTQSTCLHVAEKVLEQFGYDFSTNDNRRNDNSNRNTKVGGK